MDYIKSASQRLAWQSHYPVGLHCDIITDFTRLMTLAQEWQSWTDHNPLANVFQRWGWTSAFWTAYAHTLSLFAVVVYNGTKALGILPLVRRGNRLEFLGSPEFDYNDLLCEDGAAPVVLAAALDALLQLPHAWHSGVLNHLPANSLIVTSIPFLPSHLRRHLQLLVECSSPAVVFDEDKEHRFDTLIAKDQLKRYEKKLQKIGSVSFRHIETPEEARAHLKTFFYQHITRQAMNGIRSQFLDPKRRVFYESLVAQCDLRTCLRFAVLELDSRPVAYHFGAHYNSKFICYKPTFDVNYWDYCPGDVLFRHLFRYLRESDIDEFDFSIGDEDFKFRFANRVKNNYVMYIQRDAGRIQNCIHESARYLVAAVRQNTAVKAFRKSTAGRAYDTWRQFTLSDAIGELFHNWKRNSVSAISKPVWRPDQILFFSKSAEYNSGRAGVGARPADLASLAALSVLYPRGMRSEQLHECRRRLKRGDRAFIGCNYRGEALIFWISSQNEIFTRQVGANCRLRLERPAFVLSDCMIAPRFGSCTAPLEFLRPLAEHFTGSELWIVCPGDEESTATALGDAGFHLRYRFIRHPLQRKYRVVSVTSREIRAPADNTDRRTFHAGS